MFFYIVLTPISTTSGEVPAIRVNATKSTYTFTSVYKAAIKPEVVFTLMHTYYLY